jgi:hypothetical protein
LSACRQPRNEGNPLYAPINSRTSLAICKSSRAVTTTTNTAALRRLISRSPVISIYAVELGLRQGSTFWHRHIGDVGWFKVHHLKRLPAADARPKLDVHQRSRSRTSSEPACPLRACKAVPTLSGTFVGPSSSSQQRPTGVTSGSSTWTSCSVSSTFMTKRERDPSPECSIHC